MNLNRLALRLALTVTAVGGLLALLAYLFLPAIPLWVLLVGVVGMGGASYGAAHGAMARRLELARSTLEQLRRHQFDDLEAMQGAGGDELDHLLEELYRTGQSFEQEIRQFKKIENYRREFIGDVSHELKTPIFSIQGFSETLLDGALEDETVRRSFVEKIMRNADRMNNLARDLTKIAHIETGALEMQKAPFDIGQLVIEVNESLELVAEEKQIDLVHQVPEELPLVKGDRDRIRQVLTNLVDNALKYNTSEGSVEVVTRQVPSGAIKTYVVDDGIGVAPEHVERLTERFYRVDKSRSRGQGGTGLGLAIVKHILGAHDTRLMVSSTPGHGSTFGFALPAAESPPSGAEEAKESDEATSDGRAGSKDVDVETRHAASEEEPVADTKQATGSEPPATEDRPAVEGSADESDRRGAQGSRGDRESASA